MTEHGAPRERDVQVVRVLLEEGRALTKDDVRRRWGVPERRFRAAVSALRLEGYAVISDSAEGSTYRKARTQGEVVQFVEHELLSRARILEKQAREMLERARIEFSDVQQMELVR